MVNKFIMKTYLHNLGLVMTSLMTLVIGCFFSTCFLAIRIRPQNIIWNVKPSVWSENTPFRPSSCFSWKEGARIRKHLKYRPQQPGRIQFSKFASFKDKIMLLYLTFARLHPSSKWSVKQFKSYLNWLFMWSNLKQSNIYKSVYISELV